MTHGELGMVWAVVKLKIETDSRDFGVGPFFL